MSQKKIIILLISLIKSSDAFWWGKDLDGGDTWQYGTTKIIRNKLLKKYWRLKRDRRGGREQIQMISNNLHFAEKVCSPLGAVEVLIITEKQTTVRLLG